MVTTMRAPVAAMGWPSPHPLPLTLTMSCSMPRIRLAATATVQNAIAVPIQSVTVRSTDSKLSPEEREKQTAQSVSKDDDNKAEVTNQTLEKQKEREQRDKLQRVVFIKNGDVVHMQQVETGIADTTFIEIKSGIKPGDEVVSGSYTVISRKLKDGAKVAIEKAKT